MNADPEVPAPVGYQWITLRALTNGREVFVPDQITLPLDWEWQYGPDHNCAAMGCGWEHVIGRFPLPQKPKGDPS